MEEGILGKDGVDRNGCRRTNVLVRIAIRGWNSRSSRAFSLSLLLLSEEVPYGGSPDKHSYIDTILVERFNDGHAASIVPVATSMNVVFDEWRTTGRYVTGPWSADPNGIAIKTSQQNEE